MRTSSICRSDDIQPDVEDQQQVTAHQLDQQSQSCRRRRDERSQRTTSEQQLQLNAVEDTIMHDGHEHTNSVANEVDASASNAIENGAGGTHAGMTQHLQNANDTQGAVGNDASINAAQN